jgi:hypothetical protein
MRLVWEAFFYTIAEIRAWRSDIVHGIPAEKVKQFSDFAIVHP